MIRVREPSSLRQSRQNGALAYKNFKSMYDGIASKLSTTVAYLDKQGKIVDTKEQAFGPPTKNTTSGPDKLVFIYEVGSNASTTKDGNVGSETFLRENWYASRYKQQQRTHILKFLGPLPHVASLLCVQLYSQERNWQQHGCFAAMLLLNGKTRTMKKS